MKNCGQATDAAKRYKPTEEEMARPLTPMEVRESVELVTDIAYNILKEEVEDLTDVKAVNDQFQDIFSDKFQENVMDYLGDMFRELTIVDPSKAIQVKAKFNKVVSLLKGNPKSNPFVKAIKLEFNKRDFSIVISNIEYDENQKESWQVDINGVDQYSKLSKLLKVELASVTQMQFVGKALQPKLGFLGNEQRYPIGMVFSTLIDKLGNSQDSTIFNNKVKKNMNNPIVAQLFDESKTVQELNTMHTEIFRYIGQMQKWEYLDSAHYLSEISIEEGGGTEIKSTLFNPSDNNRFTQAKRKVATYIQLMGKLNNKSDYKKLAKELDGKNYQTILTTLKEYGLVPDNVETSDDRRVIKLRDRLVKDIESGYDPFGVYQKEQGVSLNMTTSFVGDNSPSSISLSHTNQEGKRVYEVNKPNYLAKLTNSLKEAKNNKIIAERYKAILNDPFITKIPLYKQLLNGSLRPVIFNSTRQVGEQKGTEYGSMNEKQLALQQLSMFLLASPSNANIVNAIHSDAGIQTGMKVLIRTKDGKQATGNNGRLNKEEMLDSLVQLAELEREMVVDRKGKGTQSVQRPNDHIIFPFLKDKVLADFPKLIQENIDKSFAEYEKKIESLGLIQKAEKTITVNNQEVIKEVSTFENGMFKNEKDTTEALYETMTHHLLYNAQLSLMFNGDPSYYGNIDYSKDVGKGNNGVATYFKRTKQIWSPLNYLYVGAQYTSSSGKIYTLGEKFNTVVLGEVETYSADFFDFLKEHHPEYVAYNKDGSVDYKNSKFGEVSLTDAQSYIDPIRLKQQMIGSAEWNDDWEASLDKMLEGKFNTNNPKLYGPQKPFYVNMHQVNGRMVPFQNKDSEFIMLPVFGIEIINGKLNPLFNPMHKWMLTKMGYTFTATSVKAPNQQDRFNRGSKGNLLVDKFTFDSAVKVGNQQSYDITDIAMNSDIADNINDNVRLTKKQLEYLGRKDINDMTSKERSDFYSSEGITKEDGSRITEEDVTNNPTFYQNVSGQKNKDYIASEKTIRELAARLADRIGIPVKFESDRTKNYKGKLEKGTAYINLAYATLDTPVHEILGHPIVRSLKNSSNKVATSVKNLSSDITSYEEYIKQDGVWGQMQLNLVTYKQEFTPLSEMSSWAEEVFDNKIKAAKLPSNERSILFNNLVKELETGVGKEVLDRIKKDYAIKSTVVDNRSTTSSLSNRLKELAKESGQTKQADFAGVTEIPKNLARVTHEGTLYEYRIPELGSADKRRGWYEVNVDKYSLEEQQEEAIVELLGMMTADRLNNSKDGKLIGLLKRVLREINKFVKALMREKELSTEDFSDNMSIGDIADILAYSNNKILLPGTEALYTTPDNKTFKTYAEASSYISSLASENADLFDIDLSKTAKESNSNKLLTLVPKKVALKFRSERMKKDSMAYESFDYEATVDWSNNDFTAVDKDGNEKYHDKYSFIYDYYQTLKEKDFKTSKDKEFIILLDSLTFDSISDIDKSDDESFETKNKEYEDSRRIIEAWVTDNNIVYDPQEAYDRGQGFYHELGAFANFDVNLMMQNILQHIEDNQTAGGEFSVSAYTADVNKASLKGGTGKIRFNIKPQPQDIKWAADRDVYSGSVWDAGEKFNKDKASELTGVVYSKYPSTRGIDSVVPSISEMINKTGYESYNEMGIALTGTNFRVEYDADIPYETKKIIDSINSILETKYGKIQETKKIKANLPKAKYKIGDYFNKNQPGFIPKEGSTKVTTQDEVDYLNSQEYLEYKEPVKPISEYKVDSSDNQVSLEDLYVDSDTIMSGSEEDPIYGGNPINIFFIINPTPSAGLDVTASKIGSFNTEKEAVDALEKYKKDNPIKEVKSTEDKQALVNTKVTALKAVARKQPRSLIRSKVVNSQVTKAVREKSYDAEFEAALMGMEEDIIPDEVYTKHKSVSSLVASMFEENTMFQKVEDQISPKERLRIIQDQKAKESFKKDNYSNTMKVVQMDNAAYGKQGEVPNHILDDEQKMAVQVRKNIIKDINPTKMYEAPSWMKAGMMSGRQLIEKFNELEISNLEKDMEAVGKRFNDPSKSKLENMREVTKMLQEAILERDMDSRFMELIQLDSEGNTKLELDHPAFIYQIRQVFNAIYSKKVIQQKLTNGVAYANTSPFGFDPPKVVTNAEGGIEYYEAYAPVHNSVLNQFIEEGEILDYDTMKERVQKATYMSTEEFDKLVTGIVWRIPNEKVFSNFHIKITKFFPSEMGGSIVLPLEMTELSGADFDIDKMYGFYYNYHMKYDKGSINELLLALTDKETKYIESEFPNMTTAEAVREVVENGDIIGEVNGTIVQLDDYHDLKVELTKRLRDIGKKLKRNPKLVMPYSDSKKGNHNKMMDLMQLIMKQGDTAKDILKTSDFSVLQEIRKKLIPPSKPMNPFEALTHMITSNRMLVGKQLIGPLANINSIIALLQQGDIRLTTPLKFKGNNYSSLSEIEVDGVKPSDTIGNWVAAIVDNGKDPLAGDFNVNWATIDTLILMLSAGMDHETSLAFLNEKVIRDYAEFYLNNGGNMQAEKKANLEFFGSEDLDIKELKANQKNYTPGSSNKDILNNFLLYKTMGQQLGTAVTALKVAEGGLGASAGHTLSKIKQIHSGMTLEGKGSLDLITGVRDLILDDKFVHNKMYKVLLEANEMISETLGVADYSKGAYSQGINYFAAYKKSASDMNLTKDEIDNIAHNLRTYLLSSTFPYNPNLINNMYEGLPKFMKAYPQYAALMDVLILDKDSRMIKHKGNQTDLGHDAEYYRDIIKFMVYDDTPAVQKFVKALGIYSFYSDGFGVSPFGFSHLLPVNWFTKFYPEGSSKSLSLKSMSKNELTAFTDQYVRNNFMNLSYIPNAYGMANNKMDKIPTVSGLYKDKQQLFNFNVKTGKITPVATLGKYEKGGLFKISGKMFDAYSYGDTKFNPESNIKILSNMKKDMTQEDYDLAMNITKKDYTKSIEEVLEEVKNEKLNPDNKTTNC